MYIILRILKFLIIWCYVLYRYIFIFLRKLNFFHKLKNVIHKQFIEYISIILNNNKIKNTYLDYLYNYEYVIHNIFL